MIFRMRLTHNVIGLDVILNFAIREDRALDSTSEITENECVTLTGIDHVVLHVANLKDSLEFYINVLGMTEDHGGEDYMFLKCGNQVVGLFEVSHGQEVNEGPDLNHMAFNAEQNGYDTVKSSLENQGVQVRARDGDPHCVYFDDPDGHTLQINVQR